MGQVITLEIPNHLFATKVEGVSPHPETGEFIKYINDFVTLRVAPGTMNDKFQHVVTTYQKLQDLADFRQGYTDPSEPDFIDLLIYFLSKGVVFRPDIKFRRRDNLYFGLNLVIKVSNAEYTSGTMPVDAYQSLGSGEDGDAAVDAQRTWEQWVTFVKNGNLSHSNDTHKFIYYTTGTHDEYAALLNHIATIGDDAAFDVLSTKEFNAQVVLDTPV